MKNLKLGDKLWYARVAIPQYYFHAQVLGRNKLIFDKPVETTVDSITGDWVKLIDSSGYYYYCHNTDDCDKYMFHLLSESKEELIVSLNKLKSNYIYNLKIYLEKIKSTISSNLVTTEYLQVPINNLLISPESTFWYSKFVKVGAQGRITARSCKPCSVYLRHADIRGLESNAYITSNNYIRKPAILSYSKEDVVDYWNSQVQMCLDRFTIIEDFWYKRVEKTWEIFNS